MLHLDVEDLPCDAARLVQDDAAELGVGVELEVLALVEEAQAPHVDEHAVRIRQAVGLVGELAVAVRRRVGVDRCRVAARPLAVRQRAQLHRHAQPVAGVVARAAHLGMVPGSPQIAGAPLRIRFEAAAAQHDGVARHFGESLGPLDDHARDAAGLVLQESRDRAVVADLNALPLGRAEPHRGEPNALVLRPDHGARRPLERVPHLDGRERDGRLHLDTLPLHPAGGVVGPADQDLRQLGIGAPVGDAQEISHEEPVRVGLDAREEAGHLGLGVRHEDAKVLGAVERDSQEPAAIVRVAATKRPRRLLQRHDAPGALLAGGHRRRQGGIARAHHDDVVVAHGGKHTRLQGGYTGADRSLWNPASEPWRADGAGGQR